MLWRSIICQRKYIHTQQKKISEFQRLENEYIRLFQKAVKRSVEKRGKLAADSVKNRIRFVVV